MQFLPNRVLDDLRRPARVPDLSGTRYELGEELGRGEMGIVYAARDTRLNRQIALTVIDADFGPLHAGTDPIQVNDVMRGDRPRPLAAIAQKALAPDPVDLSARAASRCRS
jgi:serine/threonine protein kinase